MHNTTNTKTSSKEAGLYIHPNVREQQHRELTGVLRYLTAHRDTAEYIANMGQLSMMYVQSIEQTIVHIGIQQFSTALFAQGKSQTREKFVVRWQSSLPQHSESLLSQKLTLQDDMNLRWRVKTLTWMMLSCPPWSGCTAHRSSRTCRWCLCETGARLWRCPQPKQYHPWSQHLSCWQTHLGGTRAKQNWIEHP